MDKILGGIIDDYTLFKIIEGIIIILILVAVYLGVQITLTWKFLKKEEVGQDDLISNRESFYKNTIFLFIAGFFMLIHEFFEGLGANAPDYTTYEFFEMIGLLGWVLFINEWLKMLRKLKKKQSV
jgi:hypothetical protein